MRELNIHIKNLISDLKRNGIHFSFDQEITKGCRLENVIFEKNGIEYKIYEGLFFRDFGQCKYFKSVKNNFELVNYVDLVFYEDFKLMILKWFEQKKLTNE